MTASVIILLYIISSILLGLKVHYGDKQWRRTHNITTEHAYYLSFATMLLPTLLIIVLFKII